MEFAVIFVLGMIIGVISEFLFAILHDFILRKPFRINHSFTVGKKISLIVIPIWGMIALLISRNDSYAILFLFAAIVGPLMELTMGKTFHKVFGIKVWTYKYGSIGEYTSIYAVPYWGAAALLFVLLAKVFGV